MERTCKKCGETKPIEKFKKRDTCIYGRGHVCKTCSRKSYRKTPAYKKARVRANARYRKKYPDKIKEYDKKYRLSHPYGERQKETEKKRRKKNADKLTDRHVINVIRHVKKIKAETIRQYPEFIQTYRQQLKVKRLLKQKQDENTKTG